MVKPFFNSSERYETARECIEAQFKEYGIFLCVYVFDDDGVCYSEIWDSMEAKEATAEEMLEIAVERVDKFGEVVFEGFGTEKYPGPVAYIGCFDENAFERKYPLGWKERIENATNS